MYNEVQVSIAWLLQEAHADLAMPDYNGDKRAKVSNEATNDAPATRYSTFEGTKFNTTIHCLLSDVGGWGKGALLLHGATAMTGNIKPWISLAQAAPNLTLIIFEVTTNDTELSRAGHYRVVGGYSACEYNLGDIGRFLMTDQPAPGKYGALINYWKNVTRVRHDYSDAANFRYEVEGMGRISRQ